MCKESNVAGIFHFILRKIVGDLLLCTVRAVNKLPGIFMLKQTFHTIELEAVGEFVFATLVLQALREFGVKHALGDEEVTVNFAVKQRKAQKPTKMSPD